MNDVLKLRINKKKEQLKVYECETCEREFEEVENLHDERCTYCKNGTDFRSLEK